MAELAAPGTNTAKTTPSDKDAETSSFPVSLASARQVFLDKQSEFGCDPEVTATRSREINVDYPKRREIYHVGVKSFEDVPRAEMTICNVTPSSSAEEVRSAILGGLSATKRVVTDHGFEERIAARRTAIDDAFEALDAGGLGTKAANRAEHFAEIDARALKLAEITYGAQKALLAERGLSADVARNIKSTPVWEEIRRLEDLANWGDVSNAPQELYTIKRECVDLNAREANEWIGKMSSAVTPEDYMAAREQAATRILNIGQLRGIVTPYNELSDAYRSTADARGDTTDLYQVGRNNLWAWG